MYIKKVQPEYRDIVKIKKALKRAGVILTLSKTVKIVYTSTVHSRYSPYSRHTTLMVLL